MTATAITNLEREIAEKTAQLELLKKQEAHLELMGPEYVLAIHLHDKCCKWNHTEGCSWHYEIKKGEHDWTGYAHSRWLKHAKMFLSKLKEENVEQEVAFKVFEIFNSMN